MKEINRQDIQFLEEKYKNHAIIVNKGKVKIVDLLKEGNTVITSYDGSVKRVEFTRSSDF